jgi:DNA-directed RNA polymerase specialized sigma24 family protein
LSALGEQTASPMPTLQELIDGWQRQETLEQALRWLSERCRSLLTLLFLDPAEPSYDEVSERLGIAKGSIGPTRNRCLDQLRLALEGLGFKREMDG